MAVANCFELSKPVNQNTNVAAEVCKVARKRTSVLAVKGFSVVNRQILFQFDQRNLFVNKSPPPPKKNGKKKAPDPDPESAFY